MKREAQVLEAWQGYYVKDENNIELAFKDFTCPPEGGIITGHTGDGKTV